jgi:hypothetical protein
VVAAGKGRESVDGRSRPGNEVKRTLTVGEAMMRCSEIVQTVGKWFEIFIGILSVSELKLTIEIASQVKELVRAGCGW